MPRRIAHRETTAAIRATTRTAQETRLRSERSGARAKRWPHSLQVPRFAVIDIGLGRETRRELSHRPVSTTRPRLASASPALRTHDFPSAALRDYAQRSSTPGETSARRSAAELGAGRLTSLVEDCRFGGRDRSSESVA